MRAAVKSQLDKALKDFDARTEKRKKQLKIFANYHKRYYWDVYRPLLKGK